MERVQQRSESGWSWGFKSDPACGAATVSDTAGHRFCTSPKKWMRLVFSFQIRQRKLQREFVRRDVTSLGVLNAVPLLSFARLSYPMSDSMQL